MFKKVLIAEDLDSINGGLKATLGTLGIDDITHVKYCDDAILKLKRALYDEAPYDLLISDLSFEEDYRLQNIKSGKDLLKEVNLVQPNLKTIAFSVEDRIHQVRYLFQEAEINAYVCKGRNGLKSLKKAITKVYNGEQFLSREVENALKDDSTKEIDPYDLNLLLQLSYGFSQGQIAKILKEENISPNSLSTIEKRVSKLCSFFKANNTTHLVAITKDMGLI